MTDRKATYERPDAGVWDSIHEAVIEVRDAYPRKKDDAPSDRVADAVVSVVRGFLTAGPMRCRDEECMHATEWACAAEWLLP